MPKTGNARFAFFAFLYFATFHLLIAHCSAYEVRIDCHPGPQVSESRCKQRGCVWSVAPARVPWCIFNASDPRDMAGYDVIKIKTTNDSVSVVLKRRSTPTLFGHDFEYLTAKFSAVKKFNRQLNPFTMRMQIYPSSGFRRNFINEELPSTITFRPKNAKYTIRIQTSPFGFYVTAGKKNTIIFDTVNLPGFTFSRNFLQLTSRAATKNVYGIGEQFHLQLKRDFNWKRYSLLTRDRGPTVNQNLYGFQPFYMGLDIDNKPYGVFSKNRYPMDYFLQPDPDLITFRMIGGEFDMFIFAGFDKRPDQVIMEYTTLIGKPVMPPLWGLGFQLCRYGYRNLTFLQKIYDRNRKAQIPQDVQYIDIDYMDELKDFTYDKIRFAKLPDFIKNVLHKTGRKLVLITDPCIAMNNSDYSPYITGLSQDVFIKDSRTQKPLEARVWPGTCAFPDFVTNPNTTNWWQQCISDFHQTINFDGIWLDMNDPSNVVPGSTTGCAKNSINYPPYSPVSYSPIFRQTVCMDAEHTLGKHIEHHNVYGHFETILTNKVLRQVFPGKRPFVLTRSTSPGSGHFGAHWMGDTFSNWQSLNQSIISLLEFNMFGIPWAGTDVCGFNGNTNEELCLRWSQLGAFYPFCRNHNDKENKVEQDPAAWPLRTMRAIRKSLFLRYSLLPYLYTLFYKSHKFGVPVVRPLFFQFPDDSQTHNIHDQFLWGSDLMIAPILVPYSQLRPVYFPKGRWYNINEELMAVDGWQKGRWLTAVIPRDSIGLFVREGGIIPWQIPGQTTSAQRNNPLGLTVALHSTDIPAKGNLYWDDGESLSLAASCFIHFRASAGGATGTLQILAKSRKCVDLPRLKFVNIAGLKMRWVARVKCNGRLLGNDSFAFNVVAKTLRLTRLSIDLKKNAVIQWFQK